MKIIVVLFSVFLVVKGQQASILNQRCAALTTTADTFIRNSFDCRGYHVCRNRAYLGSALCAPGLYYDGNQRCEFAQNVECAVCPATSAPLNTQHPVRGACNKYALCINEEIFVVPCASGLIFTAPAGCVAPDDTPLDVDTPLANLPCSACPDFFNTPAFVQVPDIWECNRAIRCFPYIGEPAVRVLPRIEVCPNNGVFDSTTGSCTTAPGATCGSAGAPEECPAGPGVVYLPDPNDCKFYFTCVNGQRLPDRTPCATDYGFNPDPAVRRCVPLVTLPDCPP